MAESAPWVFRQNNIVMLTQSHNHAPGILLWQCSCHRNSKQNSESYFNYDANLTSVITMELKTFFSLRCWFLCMTSLPVTSSMLKISVKFEVLFLNSGYAPGDWTGKLQVIVLSAERNCADTLSNSLREK